MFFDCFVLENETGKMKRNERQKKFKNEKKRKQA